MQSHVLDLVQNLNDNSDTIWLVHVGTKLNGDLQYQLAVVGILRLHQECIDYHWAIEYPRSNSVLNKYA